MDAQDRHTALTRLALVVFLGLVWLKLFGLPPVELHTPLHRLGVMDPLCGLTRGITAIVRGEVAFAFRYHPLAPLLAGAVFLWIVRGAAGLVMGRWVTVRLQSSRLLVGVLVVTLAALWINQQLHADVLLEGRATFLRELAR